MIRKKIGPILAGAAIILATSSSVPGEIGHAETISETSKSIASAKSIGQGEVTAKSGLRFRASASTKGKIIQVLKKGTKVTLMSETNGWYKAQYNGKDGYVSSEYIKIIKASNSGSTNTSSTTAKNQGMVANTNGSGLNIRKSNSTKSNILLTIKEGTKFEIISKSGDWYKIKYSNKTGFVSAKYVKTINNTNTDNKVDTGTSIVGKGTVVNTGGVGLNIRSSNNLNGKILGAMIEGTTFEIVSKSGDWYKMKYSNITGYVHKDYVKVAKETPKEPVKETPKEPVKEDNKNNGSKDVAFSSTGYVGDTEGLGLLLRNTPSFNSTNILTIGEGVTLTITAKNGEFYKVNYNGKVGYVTAEYVILGAKPSGSAETAFSSAGYVYDTEGLGLLMRQGPSQNHTVIGDIPEGGVVTITAKNGAWYKVNYNGRVGYAHSDYIKLGGQSVAPVAPVTPPSNGEKPLSSSGYVYDTEGLGLLMRSSASTSSTIMMTIPEGASLTVLAEVADWYKVSYGGKTGYAHSDYIKLGSKPVNNKATFDSVFAIMKEHIGTPYVWGGSGEYITDSSIASLKSRFPYEAADGWYNYIGRQYYNNGYRAFDCSGLMQWAFRQVGISFGRTTYVQVNAGVGVSKANAQPGDLLITNNQEHVGMYIGNGQWIEAPAPGYSVRISSFNWNNIGYVRRVL